MRHKRKRRLADQEEINDCRADRTESARSTRACPVASGTKHATRQWPVRGEELFSSYAEIIVSLRIN